MADNNLFRFLFGDKRLRVHAQDGSAWCIINDVCAALDIANPRDAAARLDDDEKSTIALRDDYDIENPNVGITSSKQDISENVLVTRNSKNSDIAQRRTYTIINESGLYALIFTSRKPEARAFRKWVTNEVLPAIRQTGHYQQQPTHVIPPRLHATIDSRRDLLAIGLPLSVAEKRAGLHVIITLLENDPAWQNVIGYIARKDSDSDFSFPTRKPPCAPEYVGDYEYEEKSRPFTGEELQWVSDWVSNNNSIDFVPRDVMDAVWYIGSLWFERNYDPKLEWHRLRVAKNQTRRRNLLAAEAGDFLLGSS